MAQFDFTTADGPIVGTKSFPNTRADINSALLALISNSSGDAEPTGTQANQFWYETDTNILKIRNEANDGWINVLTLDESMTVSASELNLLDDLTRGSILYGNASGATARLAKGGADTVLPSDGTDISWAAAGGGGGLEFISSVDLSSDANYTFTGFDDSKYDNYIFYLAAVTPASDNQYFTIQTSTDGGSNYATSAGDYKYLTSFAKNTSVTSATGDNLSGSGPFISTSIGTATEEQGGIYGTVMMIGPHLAQYTRINSYLSYWSSPGSASSPAAVIGQSAVTREAAEDVNAIRLLFYSANIASGTITAYGLKNS